MGRVTAKGDNSEKLQEQLVEKAKGNGADGIIIESFRDVITGTEITRDDDGQVKKTEDQNTLKVTAIFIKYKKNL